MIYRRKSPLLLALLLLVTTLVNANAAGGVLTGTVTDPKGALVSGATITVLDAAGNQAHAPVTTDARGHFKIEGLPAGTYTVVVSATGFKEVRRERVVIEEGKSVVTDARLEIAPVEAGTVEVKAGALKPNEDPVYQQLRKQGEAQDIVKQSAERLRILQAALRRSLFSAANRRACDRRDLHRRRRVEPDAARRI